MSQASRAVNRIRELYRIVLLRMRALNARLFDPPPRTLSCARASTLEPLEPRVLLSGDPAFDPAIAVTAQYDDGLDSTFGRYVQGVRAEVEFTAEVSGTGADLTD